MPTDLASIMERLRPNAWERTLVCNPEDETALSVVLDAMPEAKGRVRLLARSICPVGTAYFIDDDVIDAPMRDPWTPVWRTHQQDRREL